MLELRACSKMDAAYRDMRSRHYIPNKDCIGMQLHYLVMLDEEQVGVITASSPTWSVKARDEFFGVVPYGDHKRRGKQLKHIANNSVFRLERNIPNLGSQTLALFRRRAAHDWQERYGVELLGWETFVEPSERRHGSLYLAENWKKIGRTKGISKLQKGNKVSNNETRVERGKTSRKLIFARWQSARRVLPVPD